MLSSCLQMSDLASFKKCFTTIYMCKSSTFLSSSTFSFLIQLYLIKHMLNINNKGITKKKFVFLNRLTTRQKKIPYALIIQLDSSSKVFIKIVQNATKMSPDEYRNAASSHRSTDSWFILFCTIQNSILEHLCWVFTQEGVSSGTYLWNKGMTRGAHTGVWRNTSFLSICRESELCFTPT